MNPYVLLIVGLALIAWGVTTLVRIHRAGDELARRRQRAEQDASVRQSVADLIEDCNIAAAEVRRSRSVRS